MTGMDFPEDKVTAEEEQDEKKALQRPSLRPSVVMGLTRVYPAGGQRPPGAASEKVRPRKREKRAQGPPGRWPNGPCARSFYFREPDSFS